MKIPKNGNYNWKNMQNKAQEFFGENFWDEINQRTAGAVSKDDYFFKLALRDVDPELEANSVNHLHPP